MYTWIIHVFAALTCTIGLLVSVIERGHLVGGTAFSEVHSSNLDSESGYHDGVGVCGFFHPLYEIYRFRFKLKSGRFLPYVF